MRQGLDPDAGRLIDHGAATSPPMTDIASSPTPATSLPELSGRRADDLAHLDAELGRGGHPRRAGEDGGGPPRIAPGRRVRELATGRSRQPRPAHRSTRPFGGPQRPLVLLTKRAALIESQVDVLEGRRRALGRYRDALAAYAESLSRSNMPIPAARPAKIAPAALGRRGTPGVRRPSPACSSTRRKPASRDRPGDARRPRPEPDQHRPAGPDRRAAGGDGSRPRPATRSVS